ncbi:MAG: SpoIIE family protein phosphatase [candidate division KSB1 bacterium]|nr:SpoIIE family protein phosphatase [candidate division KSB1 bacterium]MDZ7300528.1 SpoIIE family protein phosphatase [candidate division KSB1 bacterium]MDZ7309667.1 SpoIIE family protein phosphatase [candidate division KSB1 bacterium]
MRKRKKRETASTQTILLAGVSLRTKDHNDKLDAQEGRSVRLKKLLLRARRPVPLSLALLMFGAAIFAIFLLDSMFFIVGNFPRIIRQLRDLLFVAGLLLLLPSIAASRLIEKRNIKRALLHVFWGIVVINVLLGLANLFGDGGDSIFSSSSTFFTTAVTSLLISGCTIALWPQVRSLIYYKSKRDTSRNFRLLVIVAAIYIGYRILTGAGTTGFWGGNAFAKSAFFILILLMVLNGSRHTWIRPLNRSQKWATFWLGTITLALAITALNEVTPARYGEYSIALSSFVSVSFLFFAIYTGLTLLTLLVQLPTAGLFDEKMREIQTLRELSSNIISELEIGNLVRLITEKAVQVAKADAAWLELIDEKNDKLLLASAINLSEQERASVLLDSRHGITGWICQHRQPVLINEIETDERTAYLKKWKSNLAALIGVPLLSKGKPLGVLFSAKSDAWSFDQFDRDMLQAFANQAAVAIDNARLWQESIEKELLAQELRVAHDAQMKLLPKRMPSLPNLDIAAIAITANEVGGDYFDFFEYQDRLGIVIGDVSGKGASAAFHMAEMKGIVEAYSRIYHSPREVLVHANAALHRSIESSVFVSLIYAQIDFTRREMLYSRAGHCPIIFVRANEPPRLLQPEGIALGLDDGQIFDKVITEDRLQLQRDDVLVFYTDGVTEAMDAHLHEFEESRLIELATTFTGKNSQEILQTIVEAVRQFVGSEKAHDDYTVVVLKMK